jgi:hypothetical protein
LFRDTFWIFDRYIFSAGSGMCLAPQAPIYRTQENVMKFIATIALVLFTFSASALAQPAFGNLFYDGQVVGTVIPPAAAPMQGKDNIYPFTNGADGQLPVAAVAPGDTDYHGGKWAVHVVTWMVDVEPEILTSEAAVLDAYMDGDLTITRVLEADFKCPIQRTPWQ